ncbi:hypothetical protein LX32DRAFT_193739 [Colletotrichum zoysiae]|uniref:Uncharacterized protein n=1 Tax=Colletotrichum zoysiae TaxID=1216348 RepID=A0AAD9H6S3_9PEZI|nr:hypothetical protein LX32DRAFT_193739 [Colletotrichum zoysiae]
MLESARFAMNVPEAFATSFYLLAFSMFPPHKRFRKPAKCHTHPSPLECKHGLFASPRAPRTRRYLSLDPDGAFSVAEKQQLQTNATSTFPSPFPCPPSKCARTCTTYDRVLVDTNGTKSARGDVRVVLPYVVANQSRTGVEISHAYAHICPPTPSSSPSPPPVCRLLYIHRLAVLPPRPGVCVCVCVSLSLSSRPTAQRDELACRAPLNCPVIASNGPEGKRKIIAASTSTAIW